MRFFIDIANYYPDRGHYIDLGNNHRLHAGGIIIPINVSVVNIRCNITVDNRIAPILAYLVFRIHRNSVGRNQMFNALCIEGEELFFTDVRISHVDGDSDYIELTIIYKPIICVWEGKNTICLDGSVKDDISSKAVDTSCIYYSKQLRYIKCAVNPYGDCQTCTDKKVDS